MLDVATPEASRPNGRAGARPALLVQYWDWLQGAITGDLGRSFYTAESVSAALANRVPVTLTMVILTLLLTAVLSVLLGVVAAVGEGDRPRRAGRVRRGRSRPGVHRGHRAGVHLRHRLAGVSATGYVPPGESVLGWLKSVTLPVVALLIGAVPVPAAQFRTAVLDTASKDYVRTLRRASPSERWCGGTCCATQPVPA